jgi:hypothetical protein
MYQYPCRYILAERFSVSYGCSFVGGRNSDDYKTAAFRIPWGLQMIPAVFLLAGMTILPESPRWLARQDRWEDCHDVLALVHGKGDRNSPFVALELEDIKQMCEFERRHANVTYLNLFKPNMLNRTFIGIFTQVWSQLTGMNVMSKSCSFRALVQMSTTLSSVLHRVCVRHGWL